MATRNIVPRSTGEGQLGTTTKKWGNINALTGSFGALSGSITGQQLILVSGSVSSTGSFGRLEIAGNSSFTGNVTIGGNINIGDADTDSITISSDLTSNLVPNADSTYNIGSTSKNWKYGYIEELAVTNITASGDITNVSTTHVTASGNVDVGGNLNVSQYIYHKDDANTYLNFTDDRLRFNIGGISYIDLNDSSTAPHDITFNDGGNNIDLTIKGTSNNPLFKTDASANRIGTHGLGSPAVDFHIGGSELRVDGNISGSSTGTGSFGRVEVSGDARFQSNLIVDGKVTAQEFHTEIVSSSIIFTSGSTKFGDSSDDNHSFTGSINQSGSFSLNDGNLTVSDNIIIGGTTDLNGNLEVAGNITASLNISASGDILADGRIFEKGTSVIDHATAMSIVFGG
jgi:hypothetical protein